MSKEVVMVFDKPHFIVKLHRDMLKCDLKEGFKKELEDFVESRPLLRGSIGFLLQNVIPLDVPLKHVDTVEVDKKGHVKIKILNRKDITIPLESNESMELVEKMNELISVEKQKEAERMLEAKKAQREIDVGKAAAEFDAKKGLGLK